MTAWIILRTAGRSTLSLAESLGKDGFEVWTPVETVTLRARRSHPQEREDQAMMPSYVFARAAHLADLLALSRNPSLQHRRWDAELRRMVTIGHATFRLMRGQGNGFVTVTDGQLAPLRSIEHRRRPKNSLDRLSNGDRVRLTEGSYAGLYGEVTDCESAFPEVLIDGWKIPVRISVWLLHRNLDGERQQGLSPAAQAPTAKAA